MPKYCCPSAWEDRVSAIAARNPRTNTLIVVPVRLIGCHNIRVAPKAFDLIERPESGVEDVNDEIHKTEQYPASLLKPFRMVHAYPLFLQHRNHVLPYGPDVCIGSATRDHEIVRHVGDALQVQQYDVVGFHVLT